MMDYIPSYSDSLHADILPSYSDSLYHHGIKGMKWGVRRYQNSDGTLTDAGRKRYAVRESKGSLLDMDRTFMDADLKKADKMGGHRNRDLVTERMYSAAKTDKQVKAAESDCRKTAKEAYSAYANLYNKHAARQGLRDRLDPKTFNWYKDANKIDRQIDENVWSDHSKDMKRLLALQDKHESNVDKLRNAHDAVSKRFVKQYNDAVLMDIPNDGSKQAINRILKRYGNRTSLDIYDYDTNDKDYGWGLYNLFDY